MSVSRRRFLQRGALTAAACASIPLQGWAAGNNRAGDKNTPDARNDRPAIPTHSQGDVLAHLDRDSFASVIGSGFKVSRDASGKDAIWLRLLSITGFAQADVSPAGMAVAPKKAASQPTTTAFALTFLGPSYQPLPQDTYVFEHSRLGTFKLFIVPGGLGQDTYTAVINRLDVEQIFAGGGAQTQVPMTLPGNVPATAPVNGPVPTSSGNTAPSPEREEIQAVRRGAMRD